MGFGTIGIIEEKAIITASLRNGNYTLTNDGDNFVPLDSFIGIKDKFKMQGGTIVIGAGVEKILLSAQCIIGTTSEKVGAKNFFIYKNKEFVARTLDCFLANVSGNVCLSISPILVEVNEGDVIEVGVYGRSGDTVNGNGPNSYVTLIEV